MYEKRTIFSPAINAASNPSLFYSFYLSSVKRRKRTTETNKQINRDSDSFLPITLLNMKGK
jgi:hypothetical protein